MTNPIFLNDPDIAFFEQEYYTGILRIDTETINPFVKIIGSAIISKAEYKRKSDMSKTHKGYIYEGGIQLYAHTRKLPNEELDLRLIYNRNILIATKKPETNLEKLILGSLKNLKSRTQTMKRIIEGFKIQK